MAAYLVANYRITNAESYRAYPPAVVPTLAAHGAEVLVVDYASEAIEGEPASATIVVKFPSKEAARPLLLDRSRAPGPIHGLSSAASNAAAALEFVLRGLGPRKRVAVWLALALAGAPPTAAASEHEVAAECLARKPVVRYLHDVQDRILAAWKLPPDGLANREVVLRLRIDADGMLLAYELVSFSDRRLAQSVKYAVMLASPFPPIPSEARCVRGRAIVTTFSNPA